MPDIFEPLATILSPRNSSYLREFSASLVNTVFVKLAEIEIFGAQIDITFSFDYVVN